MKGKFEIIRFRFKTPLHISNSRSDYGKTEKMLHSDTLHAAIMQTMSLLGMSDQIRKNPPWAFSSLFPYYQISTTNYTYFFRKPRYLSTPEINFLNDPDNYDCAKDYKKIEYLDINEFQSLLNDGFLIPDKQKIHNSLYSSSRIELKDIFSTDVNPRIRKPRSYKKPDPEIFYMEKIYFSPNGGIFTLVHFENASAKDLLKYIVSALGESGIGTDRNIGNGRFIPEWDQIEIEFPNAADYITNLSLYLPNNQQELEQMTTDQACWSLLKRGGWISEPYNTYRKKSLYMFTEGSVFKSQAKDIRIIGNTANLKPELPEPLKKVEHDVFRVGKAVFLPFNII